MKIGGFYINFIQLSFLSPFYILTVMKIFFKDDSFQIFEAVSTWRFVS